MNMEPPTITSPSFPRGVSGELTGRTLTSLQLAKLDFSGPNNSAISLRVLTELVRNGSVTVERSGKQTIVLEFIERAPEPRAGVDE
jgi:hypothetical protein